MDSSAAQICRTCLNEISRNDSVDMSRNHDNNFSILEVLSFVVPEMAISVVSNPVICKHCLNLLKLGFEFKTKCINTEEHIFKHLQNNNKINLSDIPLPDKNKCPEGPKGANELSTHIALKLTSDNPLNCENCIGCKMGLSTPTEHLKILATPVICHICHKKTDTIENMRKHMAGHFRKRKCKICQKYFRDLAQLKIHLRVHTQVNPYKCSLCDKAFRQKHSLTQHLNQHVGSASVSCKYCNKVFSTKYNAKVHMKSAHTILQTCDLCGERFKTKQELVKHLETSTETCKGVEHKIEIKQEIEEFQIDENMENVKTESMINDSTYSIVENNLLLEIKEEL